MRLLRSLGTFAGGLAYGLAAAVGSLIAFAVISAALCLPIILLFYVLKS